MNYTYDDFEQINDGTQCPAAKVRKEAAQHRTNFGKGATHFIMQDTTKSMVHGLNEDYVTNQEPAPCLTRNG